jgi:cytochrome P450
MATYRFPPGPKPNPIMGNVLQMRKGPLDFVTGLQRTYGDAATIYFLRSPAVLFTRPEAVRYVLIENARNFTNREATEGLRLLLGNGLLSIDGAFHRQQRRFVQPAFHKW